MKTTNLLKGLVVAILSVLWMACGNNEAAKTETGNNNQEKIVNPPGDTTNIKSNAEASKDSASASNEKEEDDDEKGKDTDD